MEKPVFFDPSGKRWGKIKLVFFLFLLVISMYILLLTFHFNKLVEYPFLISFSASSFQIIKNIFFVYIIVAITIGVIRLVFLIIQSSKQFKKQRIKRQYEIDIRHVRVSRRALARKRYPTVSVIIPVYNEEIVIINTVNAVLKSRYPLKEILIIDDGSTDYTANLIKDYFYGSRIVHLIEKENGGKSSALNLGFRIARGDIIVTIDADTIFTPNTIYYLIKHFNDPQVAAVSGNCKIGNIRNQLSLWQHIEYVTVFNLEKRAYEEINAIIVVPGSNGAWRKRAVQEVGYYDKDTLAEDTDLTLKRLKAGYKVIMDDRAISYEECPVKIKDFVKQRFRWSYGILQALWKHNYSLLQSNDKPLKYIVIPLLSFSYVLYITSPIIDIIFIIALISGAKMIYLFALFFYFMDIIPSIYAFKLERENMRPLLWVIIQRLFYRYLISYVVWKTILTALKGSPVGWNKFERSGTNQFR